MWLVDGQQRSRAMLDIYWQLLRVPNRSDGWSLVRKTDIDTLASICTVSHTSVNDHEDADEESADDIPIWCVVLPAMPVFHQGRHPYFGSHSESRNVQRGSMFRRLQPRASRRLNADNKTRPVPPLPVGSIPLAALISPNGIFSDLALRESARAALDTFDAAEPDLRTLDDLLPWGPQFVTGHAYDAVAGADQGAPEPLSWLHLHARRGEKPLADMVRRLKGLFESRWEPVFVRFSQMLTGNRFAVAWLPPSGVSDAIDAYVRINRAGVRVRPEERALAILSRARPELVDDLADFIRRRDGGSIVSDPRELLTHESERQLGFSVWMITLTRYTTLAVLGDMARRWLGVSSIDKDTFTYRLSRVGPDETETGKRTWARSSYGGPDELIRECSKRATSALLLLDSILSRELFLDHRMARPPARALLPLIDLFYRLPAESLEKLRFDFDFRAAAARLLHWTFLTPYIDQADLEQLVIDAHGIDDAEAARVSAPVVCWHGDDEEVTEKLRRAIGRYQQSLLEISYRKHRSNAMREGRNPLPVESHTRASALTVLALHAFSSETLDARSLQHAVVGWLYAIERRGGAREFSWEAQVEGFRQSDGKVGVPGRDVPMAQALGCAGGDSDGDLFPEKQHIVPFAVARLIVNKGGTRATASPSNAIGNLTWLSRRQNSLRALADRWAVMDREKDAANLAARGLLAKVTVEGVDCDVLDVYEELRNMVIEESWRTDLSKAQHLFTIFCDSRRAWLVGQMQDWLEEPLSEKAMSWL